MLKECILALIYNALLAPGTVPDDWRKGNVAQFFKTGENDAANYLLHLLQFLFSNMNKHLAFESILADCQHGLAKPNWSRVSNLDCALNCGHKQTDVIIMDLTIKAFDKVRYHTGGCCANQTITG